MLNVRLQRSAFRLQRSHCAFTLIELLVVIAIIGTLVGLLLPAVQAAREAARRSQNSNNLKQVGLALINFEQQFRALPMLRGNRMEGGAIKFTSTDKDVSWAFLILPFMEYQTLYDKYDWKKSTLDGTNRTVCMGTQVPTYVNPLRGPRKADRPFDLNGTPHPTYTTGGTAGDYSGSHGLICRGRYIPSFAFQRDKAGAFLESNQIAFSQVRDGLSKTFVVGDRWIPAKAGVSTGVSGEEGSDTLFISDTAFLSGDVPTVVGRGTEYGFPTGPDDTSAEKFGPPYGEQTAFVFLDGHVSWLNHSMSTTVYRNLSIVADGNAITEDY